MFMSCIIKEMRSSQKVFARIGGLETGEAKAKLFFSYLYISINYERQAYVHSFI